MNKFIHFPKDYSDEVNKLIEYCNRKYNDAKASFIKNSDKLSSYRNKFKIGNIKSKENQKYMKLYEKNIKKLPKAKNEKEREKIRSSISNYKTLIQDNIKSMKDLRAEIQKMGDPQSIQKNVDIFDAFEDLLYNLHSDLEQYSTYVTSLTVTINAFEQSGVGVEKNIMKIQNKTIMLEDKIKEQLSRLIANKVKFGDKLPERLQNYKEIPYSIDQMIKDRKTKLKAPELDRELAKLDAEINRAGNLDKLNI